MPREYLRLTRAHTVPLEAVPAVIGAGLAHGTVWSTEVALWGVFGVLYHLAGYGMNSYTDWKNGYDKEDKWKQHHPLNSGGLSPQMAKSVVYSLLGLTVAYGLFLVYPSLAGMFALGTAVVAGVAYNELGKETRWKFLLISYAHTSVFVVPYLSISQRLTPAFLLGSLYVFVWVAYQISVSGEVKDMTSDEANFLKEMGAKMIDVVAYFPARCVIYGYALKTFNILVAIVIVLYLGADTLSLFVISIIGVLTLWLNTELLRSDIYDRHARIENMSMIEMFTLVIFCLSYVNVLGKVAVWSVIGAACIWVLAGNRVVWGTWVAPKV